MTSEQDQHPDNDAKAFYDRIVAERREAAFPDDGDSRRTAPRVGLALSGGGIRSATFCLGLIRGLAQNGLLRRFDFLSTVSGGGYIGAALGRLIATRGLDAAEAELKASDSRFVTWLRRNGRYLTPAGSRDFGMAIATYLRAGIAVHLELGIVAMLIGTLIVMPHALTSALPVDLSGSWSDWVSCWLPVAIGWWLLSGASSIGAYWALQVRPGAAMDATVDARFRWRTLHWAIALSAVLLPIAIAATATVDRSSLQWLIWPVVALIEAGALYHLLSALVHLRQHRGDSASEQLSRLRNQLTVALRRANLIALLLLAAAVVDALTYQLGVAAHQWLPAGGGIGIGAVIAIALRTLAEPLQRIANQSRNAASRSLSTLINIIGLVTGALLLVAWVALVQWLVFDGVALPVLTGFSPWLRAGLLLAAVGIWFLSTHRNHDTVNASSLHNFYRARLIRAYLSTGNARRHDDRNGNASVTEVVAGDDVSMDAYRPHASGGPIHLIGCCLNQTIDDRSELYNADRKGLAAVMTPRGLELDAQGRLQPQVATGTLGHWTTISGAAAAPGAGSHTTPGWALLLFVVGARLGYWVDGQPSAVRSWWRDGKSMLLLDEARALFHGEQRPWWFLSDGGHFDNTGVYALLRQEPDCIVLADCGADPQFQFDDLENLIRKARIDFDAEIEFYTRSEADTLLSTNGSPLRVIAPEDMADNQSVRGVLLARICYHRSHPARWKIGSLLVVKPNLHDALDRDLLAYARRNPAFPQQSTGDQFFDEAQWESYHRLGEDFGREMTRTWMKRIPGWSVPIEKPHRLERMRAQPDVLSEKFDPTPFWRRGMAATALGTGLGIGAIATLLVPAWQTFDMVRSERKKAEDKVAADAKEAQDLWVKISNWRDRMPDRDVTRDEQIDLKRLHAITSRQRGNERDFIEPNALLQEIRTGCGMSGNACIDNATKPAMCNAVCDPVKIDPTPRYWDQVPADPEGLRSNVVVAVIAKGYAAISDWIAPAAYRMETPPPQQQRDNDTGLATPTPPVLPVGTQSPLPPELPPIEPVGSAPHAGFPAPPPYTASTVPVRPGSGAPTSVPAAASERCGGNTLVYTQVYDASLNAAVAEIGRQYTGTRWKWAAIENVSETAAAKGRKPPRRFPIPTLIVHPNVEPGCVDALAETLTPQLAASYAGAVDPATFRIAVRQLPDSFNSSRRVIELWLPPPK